MAGQFLVYCAHCWTEINDLLFDEYEYVIVCVKLTLEIQVQNKYFQLPIYFKEYLQPSGNNLGPVCDGCCSFVCPKTNYHCWWEFTVKALDA